VLMFMLLMFMFVVLLCKNFFLKILKIPKSKILYFHKVLQSWLSIFKHAIRIFSSGYSLFLDPTNVVVKFSVFGFG